MTNDPSASSGWSRFWFTPIPTTGFAVLRVCSGLLFACWLLSFLGHHDAFFSLRGWLDLRGFLAAQRQQEALTAPIDWSILYLFGDNPTAFHVLYWCAIAVFVLFALGAATRLTSILTWVFVVSFLANPATSYEGDYLLGILAFYLMIGHVLQYQASPFPVGASTAAVIWSLVERIVGMKDDFLFSKWIFGPSAERPGSVAVNWTLRLFQIHFVIIMMTSGFHKMQMGDWWSGAALWYPLHPPMQTTLESLLRERASAGSTMFWVSLIGYCILAWQIALPAFTWRTGVVSRILLLGGGVLGWAGTMYIFKLPLFGPFIMIACLSYLTAEEWSWLKDKTLSTLGGAAKAQQQREPKKAVVVSTGIKK